MKDIHLPQDRYLVVLRRQRDHIASGTKLELEDCNAAGAKSTSASWGLCSKSPKTWPDAEDHLWPDQFMKQGRVAPKYLAKDQWCPFDTRKGSSVEHLGTSGCFYRCRLFQPHKTKEPDPMTPERALQLYDERFAELSATAAPVPPEHDGFVILSVTDKNDDAAK